MSSKNALKHSIILTNSNFHLGKSLSSCIFFYFKSNDKDSKNTHYLQIMYA